MTEKPELLSGDKDLKKISLLFEKTSISSGHGIKPPVFEGLLCTGGNLCLCGHKRHNVTTNVNR